MKKMQQKNTKIQIYKIEHKLPLKSRHNDDKHQVPNSSNQVIRIINTKFKTQEGSNHNTMFLSGKSSYSP
jgi:hypothetical protein